MQTLSNDFDSMESINQKPPLTYVLDLFKECYDRAFNQDAAAPLPKPDLEKDTLQLAIEKSVRIWYLS